jgi:hypothetical protein
MTFVSAVIRQGEVILIADSATTYEFNHPLDIDPTLTPPDNVITTTAFEEQIFFNRKKIVLENAQKIIVVTKYLVYTFSGDETEGLDVASKLKYITLMDGSLLDNVHEYFKKRKLNIEFIVGLMVKGNPFLFVYKKNGIGFFKEESKPWYCGKNFENAATYIELSINDYSSLDNDKFLITILSSLQSVSFNSRSLDYGVGGNFNGLILSKDKYRWIEDTYFFLYSVHNLESGDKYGLFRFNRDNTTFLASNNKSKIIKYNDINEKEISDKWREELSEKIRSLNVKYFVFLINIIILNNFRFIIRG